MKNAPKVGTKTGMVWELCEELVAKYGRTPTRNEVVELGVNGMGLNQNTVTTQYQMWKTYTGRTSPNAPRVTVTYANQ